MKKILGTAVKIVLALAFVGVVAVALVWKYLPESPVGKAVGEKVDAVRRKVDEWRGVPPGGDGGEKSAMPPVTTVRTNAAPVKATAAASTGRKAKAGEAVATAPETKVETAARAAPEKASLWTGLTQENWYQGAKLKESDLKGKVVLVYEFGIDEPESIEMLPAIQRIWRGFYQHPFMIIASHRQGRSSRVLKDIAFAGLGFSVYEGAAYVKEPRYGRLPMIYVVNHVGKVVYSGRSDRDATEAVVTAITDAGVANVERPEREVKFGQRANKTRSGGGFKGGTLKSGNGLKGPKRL